MLDISMFVAGLLEQKEKEIKLLRKELEAAKEANNKEMEVVKAERNHESAGLRLIAEHIRNVQIYIGDVVSELYSRILYHDITKYSDKELALVANKAKLDSLPYMSDEYKAALESVQDALRHHYRNNRHHPEFWKDGIRDMTLIDLIEMLADWKAASQSTTGGNVLESISKNRERFEISPELEKILMNTVVYLDWN